MMALKMLLVRVELTAIGFVLGVTELTLLEWLRRAAAKAQEINEHLVREVRVTYGQLDEMRNFFARTCSQRAQANGESLPESEDGRQWIWLSYAPQFRLIPAAVVGPRTYATALMLIQLTARVVWGIPCFFSNGLSAYLHALIAVYHRVKGFPHTGRRGRPCKAVLEPHQELVYAQVIKKKEQGRLKALTERVLVGAEKLAQLGLRIRPA